MVNIEGPIIPIAQDNYIIWDAFMENKPYKYERDEPVNIILYVPKPSYT